MNHIDYNTSYSAFTRRTITDPWRPPEQNRSCTTYHVRAFGRPSLYGKEVTRASSDHFDTTDEVIQRALDKPGLVVVPYRFPVKSSVRSQGSNRAQVILSTKISWRALRNSRESRNSQRLARVLLVFFLHIPYTHHGFHA